MPRDILSMYGRDTPQPQTSPKDCGGVLPGYTKDVMNYRPPQGPKNIMDPKSPGLHGVNSGVTQQPTRLQAGGSPGIGGTNHGNSGTQGKY